MKNKKVFTTYNKPYKVYVIVIGPPVIEQPQHKNDVPLKEGSGSTISCRAAGYGSLTYYWERKLPPKKWITVDSNNKTSYKTMNTGQYRCNVTNKAGSIVSPVITVYGKEFSVDSLTVCSLNS